MSDLPVHVPTASSAQSHLWKTSHRSDSGTPAKGVCPRMEVKSLTEKGASSASSQRWLEEPPQPKTGLLPLLLVPVPHHILQVRRRLCSRDARYTKAQRGDNCGGYSVLDPRLDGSLAVPRVAANHSHSRRPPGEGCHKPRRCAVAGFVSAPRCACDQEGSLSLSPSCPPLRRLPRLGFSQAETSLMGPSHNPTANSPSLPCDRVGGLSESCSCRLRRPALPIPCVRC